jgi:Domain of unknown function (DUF202)
MPVGEEDRGLQFERTTLAWWRTMLLTIVVALLIVRQSDPGVERWVAGVGIGTCLVVALAVAAMRVAQLQRRTVGAAAPGRRATIGLVAAMATMQVIGLVLVV